MSILLLMLLAYLAGSEAKAQGLLSMSDFQPYVRCRQSIVYSSFSSHRSAADHLLVSIDEIKFCCYCCIFVRPPTSNNKTSAEYMLIKYEISGRRKEKQQCSRLRGCMTLVYNCFIFSNNTPPPRPRFLFPSYAQGGGAYNFVYPWYFTK